VIHLPGQRQPIDLLKAKGKKHLTKDEIIQRKSSEVKACSDKISPPGYLSAKAQTEFTEIASELNRIGIMSNLDCDALARYVIAKNNYVKYTKILNKISAKPENLNELDRATTIQDRAFKQCQNAAKELGLTISSRCRLVVPKQEELPRNKFAEFEANG
jgi:P27 family predicted phage terminase small subunit